MNALRCRQCGADLGAADGQGPPGVCSRCGSPIPRSGPDSTSPSTSIPRLSETNYGTDSIETTILTAHPGAQITNGSGPTAESPNSGGFPADYYDFLAPPQCPDELGRLGAYRVLRVIGVGGMGVVYEAEEPVLERRVALKVLLPALAASVSARQRFLREARAAAKVEHERIVPIFQVGEDRGMPYLAMPLLKGESLEQRLAREGRLPADEVMRIGREVAEALDAAHAHGLIHRDVKPANIWLEGPAARVKLLDFGLARSLETDTPLTQQGSLVGSPAFMAPEQAAGEPTDARCDLFSLGCVLYRASTGRLPFEGINLLTTLLAVMHKQPPAPFEVFSALPAPLSALIMQLLAKKPQDRPATAAAVIEAMSAMRAVTPSSAAIAALPVTPAPVSPAELAATVSSPSPIADTSTGVSSRAGKRSRLTWSAVVAGAAAVALLAGTFWLGPMLGRLGDSPADPVEIGIAYGTEKRSWFEDAVREFAASPEGKGVKINLIPMGSQEGGQAVANDEDPRIHVWSPASSLYQEKFVRDWQLRHPGHQPIVRGESLALTPMVFVVWKNRHDAFVARYKSISFATIAQAMQLKEGWGGIGGRPEWGQFRFGHTNPTQSNSGLMTLLLMACELNGGKPLSAADLMQPAFQARLGVIERGLAGMSNSTGNLMKDMVTRGPSAFDAVFVYESLAIDYLKAARGRWDDLYVTYPARNVWSENPYYILDVPWSSNEQRKAAETFLGFLLGEPMQKRALAHGFRPANINVPIRDSADSPFVLYKDSGLSLDVGAVCDPPPQGLDELLRVWSSMK
jgi:serine/threonine protein kinase